MSSESEDENGDELSFLLREPIERDDEGKPEEDFCNIRAKQLESEERIHAIVNEWNAQRKEHPGKPSDEKLLEFLRSIQDSLCYPRRTNPDNFVIFFLRAWIITNACNDRNRLVLLALQ
uniref:Uncharacterized protein n=1 Tax=Ditylenchus dipsaci TaxID=166011 RepID=A0A915CMV9_9BILA